MLGGILFLTYNQQLSVGGFNMFAMRFLELGAFFRVMSRKEFSFSNLNKIDKVFIYLHLFTTIVFLLRSPDGQVYQIGVAVDAYLTYFAFRGMIRNIEDFRQFCIDSVALLLPYTVLVLVEAITHFNPFSLIGGGVDGGWLREGRLRCYASFRHPSLLGTLGACLLPIYIALYLSRMRRGLAIIGMALCVMIILSSNSGGPLNSAFFGILAWILWIMRRKMQLVRRALVFFLIVLGLSMKAPIWYIFAKMSAITGGDGWHRSFLMDIAFQNIGNWWLAGMPYTDTWDWFPYGLTSTGGADITNIFIAYGLTAGLGSMALFIYLLVVAYSHLGKTLAVLRANFGSSSVHEYLMWSLGVALTVHIVNWLGITYFDQTNILWLLQIAAIGSLTGSLPLKSAPAQTAVLIDHPTVRSFS